MKIGYARISTGDQSIDMQLNVLNKAECTVIYSDVVSSIKQRPELVKCLKSLNEGDTLIVYKLDRIGRSVREVVNILYDLEQRKINIISLSDHLDSSNPQGRLMLNILLSFAQFERELIVQRVNQGLKTAREKGIKLGRKSYLDRKKAKLAYKMRVIQHYTVDHICRELNLTKPTFYRYVAMFK
jgi:DNA invertase Pin-like site-specific DNA recombinase